MINKDTYKRLTKTKKINEHCSEHCADFQECNARFAEDENATLPAEEYCIKNIIKFFENEVEYESNRD